MWSGGAWLKNSLATTYGRSWRSSFVALEWPPLAICVVDNESDKHSAHCGYQVAERSVSKEVGTDVRPQAEPYEC